MNPHTLYTVGMAACLTLGGMDLLALNILWVPAMRASNVRKEDPPPPERPLVASLQPAPSAMGGSGPAPSSLIEDDEDPVAEPLPRGKRVFFRTNSTDLLPQTEAEIAVLASLLLQRPSVRVRVEGHADHRGEPAYNHNLSIGRAKAVAARLVALGISKSRITVMGFGDRRPLSSIRSGRSLARNRRVEFRLEEADS